LIGERAAARFGCQGPHVAIGRGGKGNPQLSLKIEIVVLQDDKPDEHCQITIQNGIVETREPRGGLDMILKAKLEDWLGLIDGAILKAPPFGEAPLYFAGDLGKFAQFEAAWNATMKPP
jgi:hypothetical protein